MPGEQEIYSDVGQDLLKRIFHVVVELEGKAFQLRCPVCGKDKFKKDNNGKTINCANCKTFLAQRLEKKEADPGDRRIH